MKYKFPEFYRDCLPSERGYIYDMDFFAMLPTCDKLGRKVCILYPGMCTWFTVSVYLFSVIFVNINVVPEARGNKIFGQLQKIVIPGYT